MRLLLDTRILLWAGAQSALLPPVAASMIQNPENELYFSVMSIWEIALMRSLKRTSITADAAVFRIRLIENGYQELQVSGLQAAYVQDLPLLHKDPFDRIMIAQAIVEKLIFVTADRVVAQYPGPIQKV